MPDLDVVVVAHAADRTGPPQALLRLLRILKADTDLRVELFVFRGGELLDDFEALFPTSVIGEPSARDGKNLPSRVRGTVSDLALLRAVTRIRQAKLLFLNTTWTARLLGWVGPGGPPVVAHVHELDLGVGDLLPPADLRRFLRRPVRYVVGTPAASDNLVHRHGVDPVSIVLNPYFVEAEQPAAVARPAGVPEEAIVVGACAVAEWRKAPDLFVQLASRVLDQTDKPVHFVWVGGPAGGPSALGVPQDIESLGLGGQVHFVGNQADPWPWYAGFDMVALTSREDAFPLACLEAGSLGRPVVTFDQGGIPALVRACEGGAVVPHLDVAMMADSILELVDDAQAVAAAGDRLARHVAEVHGPGNGADLAEMVTEMVRGSPRSAQDPPA